MTTATAPKSPVSDKLRRFAGRIVKVLPGESCGFIGTTTISPCEEGGQPVTFTRDVFVHVDDCPATEFKIGTELEFSLAADTRQPGEGHFRAVEAEEILDMELVPATGDVMPGLSVVDRHIEGRHPKHMHMKEVAIEAIALRNEPLKGIPRDNEQVMAPAKDDAEIQAALANYLRSLFPALQSLELGFDIVGFDEAAQDVVIEEALASYRELGMTDHVNDTHELYKAFKANRRLLNWIFQQGWLRPGSTVTPAVVQGLVKLVEHTQDSGGKEEAVAKLQGVIGFMAENGLLRPNTVVPLESFVDLFMAAPVCYVALEGDEETSAMGNLNRGRSPDPKVHQATRDLCELFPGNERWCDLMQLFNRRCRPIKTFKGDVIPTAVAQLISRARRVFDRVIILTPYLHVAGADWEDQEWQRSIDPFVVGIKQGCPVFFFLARFSDTGLFPLVPELVADTMAYLAQNRSKIVDGFKRNPYWYHTAGQQGVADKGGSLGRLVDEMQKAYEAGHLFDWIRKTFDPSTELARETATKQ